MGDILDEGDLHHKRNRLTASDDESIYLDNIAQLEANISNMTSEAEKAEREALEGILSQLKNLLTVRKRIHMIDLDVQQNVVNYIDQTEVEVDELEALKSHHLHSIDSN